MNSASTEKAAALASGQNGIVIQPLIIDARHKVSASKYYSCRFRSVTALQLSVASGWGVAVTCCHLLPVAAA